MHLISVLSKISKKEDYLCMQTDYYFCKFKEISQTSLFLYNELMMSFIILSTSA